MWGFALFVFVWDDEDEDEDNFFCIFRKRRPILDAAIVQNSSPIKSSLRNQKNSLIYITVRAILLRNTMRHEVLIRGVRLNCLPYS